jgi:hypothetical protein
MSESGKIAISLDTSDVNDLATTVWRLQKWLDEHKSRDGTNLTVANYALRKLDAILVKHNVLTIDDCGKKYDVGLSVEVVENLVGTSDDSSNFIIVETILPTISAHNQVIQFGQVVISADSEKEA